MRLRSLLQGLSKSVILVGPDGSGKSTMALQLMKYYNYNYAKSSLKSPKMRQFENQILLIRGTILDRFYMIDEEVYGDQIMGPEYIEYMMSHAIVIYVIEDSDIIAERLLDRGDEYVVNDKSTMESLIKMTEDRMDAYEEFFKNHKLDYIPGDVIWDLLDYEEEHSNGTTKR